MSYTPTNDPVDHGLFDITRTLLQQTDLCALAQALTQMQQKIRELAAQNAPKSSGGTAAQN